MRATATLSPSAPPTTGACSTTGSSGPARKSTSLPYRRTRPKSAGRSYSRCSYWRAARAPATTTWASPGASATPATTPPAGSPWATPWRSAITELGDASAPDGTAGFDWTVDQNLVFNLWHPHRGADHGVDLIYGDNLAGVTITVTPDGYANAIYMTGGQPTTPYPPSTGPGYSAPVPAGYGAWDQQKSDPNQILQAALVDAAKGWLEQLSPVLYQAVVATLPAGVWNPDHDVGGGHGPSHHRRRPAQCQRLAPTGRPDRRGPRRQRRRGGVAQPGPVAAQVGPAVRQHPQAHLQAGAGEKGPRPRQAARRDRRAQYRASR